MSNPVNQPYQTFFTDLSNFTTWSTSLGVSRANRFQFDTPGRVFGVRMGVHASSDIGKTMWFGMLGVTSAGINDSHVSSCANVSRLYTTPIPGFWNLYWKHPLGVDTTHVYTAYLGGGFGWGAWSAAVASAPIQRGHIILPQNASGSAHLNGVQGTAFINPTSAPPTLGTIFSIDVLFLPN